MPETAKEECFREAYEAFQQSGVSDYQDQIEFQKHWGLCPDRVTWLRKSSFWHALGSYLSGNSIQFRRPDLTITSPEGSERVMDLKFDRPSGGRDRWRTERNPNGSGRNQQGDYNHLNQSKGTDYGDNDPSLDPDKCGCNNPANTAAQPVTVYEVNRKYFLDPDEAADYAKKLGLDGYVFVPGVGWSPGYGAYGFRGFGFRGFGFRVP
ncbi:MAG: hypothetical protein PVI92_12470, partial [Chromatiales bacterium]